MNKLLTNPLLYRPSEIFSPFIAAFVKRMIYFFYTNRFCHRKNRIDKF